MIGCLFRSRSRDMLRTVQASEGIVQVLCQPLRFPGLGDPQKMCIRDSSLAWFNIPIDTEEAIRERDW